MIDEDLMRRTDIVSGERVSLWNVTNGERNENYARPGPTGAGDIIVNGAAAHKCREKDIVVIVAFSLTDEPVVPKMISVDHENAFLALLADNREG